MEQDFFVEIATDDGILDLLNYMVEDSDEDEPAQRGGSRPGRQPNIERNHRAGHENLLRDYFGETPLYTDAQFRRRFRLSRARFLSIVDVMEDHDPFFVQRADCTGRLGLSALQKATAAIRILAYGYAADAVDEYIRIGESTAALALVRFVRGVIECFGAEYLRVPNQQDIQRLLGRSNREGFPGCLGSIDCTKWVWKNCPTALHGQFTGKEGVPTITIEAIADSTLWIWHLFVGMPGSHNDINVVEASPLVNKIVQGVYPPPLTYTVGGVERNKPYWLADGIYPRWMVFLQTVSQPVTGKERLFAKWQEARRKDAERAFGVLQAKWHIIARPGNFFEKSFMSEIVTCVVILHNMSREDLEEEESDGEDGGEMQIGSESAAPMWEAANSTSAEVAPGTIAALTAVHSVFNDPTEYNTLRGLIIDHVWSRFGDE